MGNRASGFLLCNFYPVVQTRRFSRGCFGAVSGSAQSAPRTAATIKLLVGCPLLVARLVPAPALGCGVFLLIFALLGFPAGFCLLGLRAEASRSSVTACAGLGGRAMVAWGVVAGGIPSDPCARNAGGQPNHQVTISEGNSSFFISVGLGRRDNHSFRNSQKTNHSGNVAKTLCLRVTLHSPLVFSWYALLIINYLCLPQT